jgi:hypothetical protein
VYAKSSGILGKSTMQAQTSEFSKNSEVFVLVGIIGKIDSTPMKLQERDAI